MRRDVDSEGTTGDDTGAMVDDGPRKSSRQLKTICVRSSSSDDSHSPTHRDLTKTAKGSQAMGVHGPQRISRNREPRTESVHSFELIFELLAIAVSVEQRVERRV